MGGEEYGRADEVGMCTMVDIVRTSKIGGEKNMRCALTVCMAVDAVYLKYEKIQRKWNRAVHLP